MRHVSWLLEWEQIIKCFVLMVKPLFDFIKPLLWRLKYFENVKRPLMGHGTVLSYRKLNKRTADGKSKNIGHKERVLVPMWLDSSIIIGDGSCMMLETLSHHTGFNASRHTLTLSIVNQHVIYFCDIHTFLVIHSTLHHAPTLSWPQQWKKHDWCFISWDKIIIYLKLQSLLVCPWPMLILIPIMLCSAPPV